MVPSTPKIGHRRLPIPFSGTGPGLLLILIALAARWSLELLQTAQPCLRREFK